MPGAASRSLLVLLYAGLACARAADISMRAARGGDVPQVEAGAELECTIARAWQVLTDYDRLARFIPNLQVSRIVSRQGDNIVVEQKGEARLLFIW
jgi:hypothetical protein